MKAPFQVLVFPFHRTAEGLRYAVFRRADFPEEVWQGIAGGGEEGEAPAEAASREAWEEAGISRAAPLIPLDSMTTLPAPYVRGFLWGPDVLVIPEHAFGIEFDGTEFQLSHEHRDYRWLDYVAADAILRWDSNRNALWELDYRLNRGTT